MYIESMRTITMSKCEIVIKSQAGSLQLSAAYIHTMTYIFTYFCNIVIFFRTIAHEYYKILVVVVAFCCCMHLYFFIFL